MSDPLLTNIDGTESKGIKFAKIQRWIKQSCLNAGISIASNDPLLRDIDGSESEGIKFAILQRWQALLANNISGGSGGGTLTPATANEIIIGTNDTHGVTPLSLNQARISASPINLPGAIGEWFFDENIGNGTVNRAQCDVGIPNNFFLLPDGPYKTHYWGNNSSVTDDYTDGPFEATRASRFLSTGGEFQQITTIPQNGIYTLSIYVKSNTGLAQKMRMNFNNDYGSDINIPSSGWTRLARTATLTAGSFALSPIVTDAAQDAIDVSFFGPCIEWGSTPSTYRQVTGSMQFYGMPEWQGGAIDFSSGPKFTAAGIPVSSTPFGFSCYALFNWPISSVAPDTSHVAIIAEALPSPNFYIHAVNSPSKLGFTAGNKTAVPALSNDVHDGNWHLVTGVYDGSTTNLYLDDVRIAYTNGAMSSPFNINTISLASIQKNAWLMPALFSYAGVFNCGHTHGQINTKFDYLRSIMSMRGITMSSPDIVFFEGDSITADQNHNPNTYPFLVTVPAGTIVVDNAISGSTIIDLNSRQNDLDGNARTIRTNNVLFVLIGFNDLNSGGDPFITYRNLRAYCRQRRQSGWNKIIVATLTPSTNSGFAAKRLAYNNYIKGDTSFYDVLADFAADPTIGPDAAAADTTYFVDGVHPTQAGQNIMATIAQSAINTILP